MKSIGVRILRNRFLRVVLIFQVLFHVSVAQPQSLIFNPVLGNNGKPLGKINAVTQDTRGYIWLAGSDAKGIYRYDGARMKFFSRDTANPNSLSFGSIETIYADNDGLIWIGGDSLDQYNPATGKFKHFFHDDKDSNSIAKGTVYFILKDSKGRLWLAVDKGLDRYDEKTGKFIHYSYDSSNPRSLSSGYVNTIYEDRQGTLWVGTGMLWFNVSPEDGGLNRLDEDGQFTRFRHDPNDPQTLINNKVRSIFEDSRGNFWIGTMGDGLHTMDRKTGKFTRHQYNASKPNQLSRPPITGDGMNDPLSFIQEDSSGYLWIGSREGGINRYDTASKTITNYKNSNGYNDGSGWRAFVSRDGSLWICTEEANLFRVDPMRRNLKNNQSFLPNTFLEDQSGLLWMGSDGAGIWVFDKDKKLVKRYTPNSVSPDSLLNGTITQLYRDGDTTWIGTSKGVYYFDKKTGKLSWVKLDKTKKKEDLYSVTGIIKAKNGELWLTKLASSGYPGLIRFDIANGTTRGLMTVIKDTVISNRNSLHFVVMESSGILWSGGSREQGVSRIDLQSENVTRYLQGIRSGCGFIDSRKVLWIGTETGLFRFDKAANKFLPFFDPLSDINDTEVQSITEDDEGNLWVSSRISLIRINADRSKIFHVGRKSGILPNTLFGAIFKKSDGEILLGNKTGFYSFYPKQVAINDAEVNLVIPDIFINNIPFSQQKGIDTLSEFSQLENLSLTYNENSISFNLGLTDYRAPELNRYFTRLEGYDSIWRETGAEKNVFYYGLNPGNYTFSVKAFDSDGLLYQKSVQIIIHPPWWRTWWAYAAYALMLGSLLFLLYRFQKQRIIRAERQKAQQFELAQAREIEKAYTELKATQAQLIQSEKMASLGELTAGIAHEIQNPLNFVNNFSELSRELIEEAEALLAGHGGQGSRQQAGENNPDVAELLTDIKKNLEKVNHHGKRADAIVKGMLQHANTKSGSIEPVDLNALAEEWLRLAYHSFRIKNPHFQAELKNNLDASLGNVNLAAQDISRVLLNLFNNAFYAMADKMKLSPDYMPVISLRTKKQDGKLYITVRDNGTGIQEKIRNKIFQPFFTTKPTGEGTGLGLSLSYDIVKAHGGELRLKPENTEGSEFEIVLPVS